MTLIDRFGVESEEVITYLIQRYIELGYVPKLLPRIEKDSYSIVNYLNYEMLIYKLDEK